MKKAVILLSGGLDSATTLYFAKTKGYNCHCLIFDYGQRHRREVASARKIAQRANCKWQIINISLPWKGSSLLDRGIKLPVRGKGIPSTYVPARNIIFLSFALSYAEAIGAEAILIGANVVDYSGYPDCRPQFFEAFDKVIRTGTKIGSKFPALPAGRHVLSSTLKVYAPLLKKSKMQIVKLAKKLKVPLELTWSCYKGGKRPCGLCDSCVFRAKGFKQARIRDPLYG